jgi:hypothetical protein
MKTKTRVRAGAMTTNHNETLVRDMGKGLKVKTRVRAGGITLNHSETLVQDKAKPKGCEV